MLFGTQCYFFPQTLARRMQIQRIRPWITCHLPCNQTLPPSCWWARVHNSHWPQTPLYSLFQLCWATNPPHPIAVRSSSLSCGPYWTLCSEFLGIRTTWHEEPCCSGPNGFMVLPYMNPASLWPLLQLAILPLQLISLSASKTICERFYPRQHGITVQFIVIYQET